MGQTNGCRRRVAWPGRQASYDRAVAEALTEAELEFLRSMFDLARNGDTEQLTAAIDAGVPVNLTNGVGDSLLMLAAYHDHPATVRALLDRGADTARVDDRGQTALAAATFRQSAESVNLLLAAGADPSLGPRSALDVAQVFDLPDMLALLTSPHR
jgi:ankyrin repeat protein